MEIGYPKDRKGLLIGISFVTMYCALLYKDRLTEHFPAYMVLNFQKVIKRLAYQIRIQGPVIQANGRLTFGYDLRSGGLLYFTVRTELADSMVTLGEPGGGNFACRIHPAAQSDILAGTLTCTFLESRSMTVENLFIYLLQN